MDLSTIFKQVREGRLEGRSVGRSRHYHAEVRSRVLLLDLHIQWRMTVLLNPYFSYVPVFIIQAVMHTIQWLNKTKKYYWINYYNTNFKRKKINNIFSVLAESVSDVLLNWRIYFILTYWLTECSYLYRSYMLKTSIRVFQILVI